MELRGTFICISKKEKGENKYSYRFVADNGQQIILHTSQNVDIDLYKLAEFSFIVKYLRGLDRNTIFVSGDIALEGVENKDGSKSGIFSF